MPTSLHSGSDPLRDILPQDILWDILDSDTPSRVPLHVSTHLPNYSSDAQDQWMRSSLLHSLGSDFTLSSYHNSWTPSFPFCGLDNLYFLQAPQLPAPSQSLTWMLSWPHSGADFQTGSPFTWIPSSPCLSFILWCLSCSAPHDNGLNYPEKKGTRGEGKRREGKECIWIVKNLPFLQMYLLNAIKRQIR